MASKPGKEVETGNLAVDLYRDQGCQFQIVRPLEAKAWLVMFRTPGHTRPYGNIDRTGTPQVRYGHRLGTSTDGRVDCSIMEDIERLAHASLPKY